jgi:2-O-methyltransferase
VLPRKLIAKYLKRAFGLCACQHPPNPQFGITIRNILEVIPENPVIIEAGGHDGTNTVELSKIPGATVYSFEPVPSVYDRLADRVKGHKNVTAYNIALGSHATTAEMYISSGRNDASSSLSKPRDIAVFNADIKFTEKIKVRVETIDEWALQNKIAKVDFMWLDMQGHELEALKGAQSLLSSLSAIYTEVNLLSVYEGIPLYHEVWEWIRDFGFKIERIDFTWADQGEVLFVRDQP